MKRLLGMLSLQRKFLLLGGLSLILFAVPLLLYVKASWETAAQKRLEAAGARPVATLLQAVRLVQAHRGLSNLHLNGAARRARNDAGWRPASMRNGASWTRGCARRRARLGACHARCAGPGMARAAQAGG